MLLPAWISHRILLLCHFLIYPFYGYYWQISLSYLLIDCFWGANGKIQFNCCIKNYLTSLFLHNWGSTLSNFIQIGEDSVLTTGTWFITNKILYWVCIEKFQNSLETGSSTELTDIATFFAIDQHITLIHVSIS